MFDTTEYNDISVTAADLERKGFFQQAAGLWEEAQSLARHEKNRNWSLARKHFCRSLYAVKKETTGQAQARA